MQRDANAYANADADTEMPMSRFPNGRSKPVKKLSGLNKGVNIEEAARLCSIAVWKNLQVSPENIRGGGVINLSF